MTPKASPRRSRIAHFKAPFIVSLVGSAALGCGGKAEVAPAGDGDSTGLIARGGSGGAVVNAPLEENGEHCPGVFPSSGSACQLEGKVCSYFSDCPWTARCVDGHWSTDFIICNPPEPERDYCPDAQPEPGTTCASYVAGLTCEYPYCYGSEPMVRCGADGVWEALPLLSCNPPQVEPCPEVMPEPGSDCQSDEQLCGYPGCQGPESSTAVCQHRQWLVEYSSGVVCNPPAVVPVCPSIEPTLDAGCAYDGQACSYGTCGDPMNPGRTHTCASGIWQTLEPPCASPGAEGADAGTQGSD